jgi:RNA polymerase sigma-70 factor, ECF subfamily
VELPELVTRARDGDHDAFATLVRATAARLDATAWLIVRDRDLARDAVQEALLRAWRDLPRLRDPGKFDAWLHRLLVNACLDVVRRRRRRSIEVELQPIHERNVSDPAGMVADWDELERAFDQLSADQRATVVLHYFVGLPVTEVAAALVVVDRSDREGRLA